MPKKEYVISDNKLYLVKTNKVYTKYEEVAIPKYEALSPEWHGKKIPLTMWQEILAFMKHSYDVLKSETMCFLYYDDKKKQPWSFWVPPQISNGMTVKSDPDHMNFQVQRAQYPDLMFGTVHHHCGTSAFQSGTDEADETNREGFHFTVGNLDTPHDIDVHFRWCLDNECHELEDLTQFIDGAVSPFKEDIELTVDMAEFETDYMNVQLKTLPDLSKYDFTTYMDNVSKPKISYGYKFNSKKNSLVPEVAIPLIPGDTISIDDIIDEALFSFKFDPDFETVTLEYLQQNGGDTIAFATGRWSDEDYAKCIKDMENSLVFNGTKEHQEIKKLITNFLDEYKYEGYEFSYDDFIKGLDSYDYRKTI